MKIKQYQSGGPTYIPTSNRREVAEQSASSSSDTTGKVSGFAKEMIDLVKENGLNSDVTTFLNQMTNVLNLAADPTGQNISMNQILQAQRLANQVKINYEDYNKARTSLNEQNAWGEMATDKRGYLYVQNQETGKLETISHSDYTKNQDKYIALTNEDVLNLRREDISLAYRTDILDNISSAVGMKTITDYAQSLIKEFGTTSITGYSEKQASKIRSGLEHIVAGDAGDFRGILTQGPDGIYKISSEATIVDTGIKEALNYLVSTMPRSYQNTLSAKATVEGYSPEAMLMQMMYYNTDRKLSVDYDKQTSEVSGYKNASTGSESWTHNTYLERIASPDWDPTEIYISPVASQINERAQLKTVGWKVGALIDKDGNGVDPYSNLTVLKSKTEAIKAADSSSITFGNQLLNPGDVKKVVWDTHSELTIVELPWRNEAGKKVPDFTALQKFNEVQEYIKNNQPSALEINNYISQKFSPDEVTYDSKTNTLQFNPKKMMKFLSFGGITSDDTMDILDETKPFLEKLSSDIAKGLVGAYNNNIQYGKQYPGKYDKPDKSVGSAGKNSLYRGNVYMPIDSAMMAFHMSNNEIVPKSNYMNVGEKWRLTKEMQALADNSNKGLNTNFN